MTRRQYGAVRLESERHSKKRFHLQLRPQFLRQVREARKKVRVVARNAKLGHSERKQVVLAQPRLNDVKVTLRTSGTTQRKSEVTGRLREIEAKQKELAIGRLRKTWR